MYLAAGTVGVRALVGRWQAARLEQRGVTFGVPGLPSGPGVDPWGVNVALEQYPDAPALGRSLDLLVGGGYHWVRQRFDWSEIEPVPGEYRWERWDEIVRECRARDLRIIAVLDHSPAWARDPRDAQNSAAPPRNPAHLAAFARALAQRYAWAIDHYQVWDEPNLWPHWGDQDVDPAGYVRLLRAARTQIRDVDPGAVVIAAGLAPTTEGGGRNLSELEYLHALYTEGARELFDVVAVKPYGFWSGPEDRRVGPGILNFSRLVALHEEMVRSGDAAKQVWAVEWGWNALPEGWQGRPSPWGNDAAWRQHDRDLRAIARAEQEWPWLGLMCYATWQPAAPADDPIWGLSLLDAQEHPGPLYQKLQALSKEPAVLYPGRHTVPAAGTSTVEIGFWGTRLDLDGGAGWGPAQVDGRPLSAPLPSTTAAPVVKGLAPGQHLLRIAGAGPLAPLQVIVSRERPPLLPAGLAAGLVAAVLLATAALILLLRSYPWLEWLARGVRAYRSLSPWAGLALGGAALLLMAAAPSAVLSLLALGLVGLLILGRPEAGLMMAVFLVPLAPLQKRFGSASFSYLELVTLAAVASQALAEVSAGWRNRGNLSPLRALVTRGREAVGRLTALDAGFVLLVGAAVLSLRASEWLWVSLRELRIVVLQAAFLYWLVTRGRLGRDGLLRLADLLVLSVTVISLHGLFSYFFTDKVIVAEGVRRIRGIYGSPNNLALVLGRVFPIMLAGVLCGPRGRRRWLYGLAITPAAPCLFLTYSRGAWVLGLPAALLTLGLLAGRRTRLATLGLAAAGLACLVPLWRTARLNTLFSGGGTSLLRLKLWEAAWDMGRDHPWFGVGLDNFLYQYSRYIRPEAMSEPNLSHPHNFLLDFWLRLGVPGLLAFGWLEWSFFRRALGLWRRREDPALWALTIGVLAGMADMLAHGLIDASFFVVELAGLFAVMVGLVQAMGRLSDNPR